MKKIIISMVNQKGGVGKTTCSVNLGASLSQEGYRVCLVDNDPQNNLTSHLIDQPIMDPAIVTVEDIYLGGKLQGKRVLKARDNLNLIPSSKRMIGMELALFGHRDKELKLKQGFENLFEGYDFADIIIIDNPPSLNTLSLNSLVASTHVLIPVQLEYFSLEGLSQMRQTIEMVQRDWNPQLKLLGIIPSLVHSRRRLNHEVSDAIKDAFPGKLFQAQLKMSVSVTESSGYAKTILEHSPRSKSAQEFKQLAQEVTRALN